MTSIEQIKSIIIEVTGFSWEYITKKERCEQSVLSRYLFALIMFEEGYRSFIESELSCSRTHVYNCIKEADNLLGCNRWFKNHYLETIKILTRQQEKEEITW